MYDIIRPNRIIKSALIALLAAETKRHWGCGEGRFILLGWFNRIFLTFLAAFHWDGINSCLVLNKAVLPVSFGQLWRIGSVTFCMLLILLSLNRYFLTDFLGSFHVEYYETILFDIVCHPVLVYSIRYTILSLTSHIITLTFMVSP